MRNCLIIICAFNIFFSCHRKNSGHDFTVTKFLRVDEGYQLSSEKKIKHGNDYYFPSISSKYRKDTLIEMILYKPEGTLRYGQEEFKTDSLILKHFRVPFIRKIDLLDNILNDNGATGPVTKNEGGDTVFCIRADTLYRYTFTNRMK